MLTIRPASVNDIPPLWAIMEDFSGQYLDDYQRIDKADAVAMVQNDEIFVVDHQGYGVAFFRFSDKLDDVSIKMHALIRPEAYRGMLRQRIIPEILSQAFEKYQVGKITASCMERQTTAVKLLRKHLFKQNGLFRNDTKQNGKLSDVFAFELHRRFWTRHKALRQKELEPNEQQHSQLQTDCIGHVDDLHDRNMDLLVQHGDPEADQNGDGRDLDDQYPPELPQRGRRTRVKNHKGRNSRKNHDR